MSSLDLITVVLGLGLQQVTYLLKAYANMVTWWIRPLTHLSPVDLARGQAYSSPAQSSFVPSPNLLMHICDIWYIISMQN